MFFFFKQKTAYEMRISDWSSDVCSSDLCRTSSGAGPRCKMPATSMMPPWRVSSTRSSASSLPMRAIILDRSGGSHDDGFGGSDRSVAGRHGTGFPFLTGMADRGDQGGGQGGCYLSFRSDRLE